LFDEEMNLNLDRDNLFSTDEAPDQNKALFETQFQYEFDTLAQYPLQIDTGAETELQLAPLVKLDADGVSEQQQFEPDARLNKWTVNDTQSPTIEVRFLLADLVEFVQFVQLYSF